MTAIVKIKPRLSKSDWLRLALEALSKKGAGKLQIDNLCRELGVTKGSFYAHFDNRADFVQQFLGYWKDNFTENIVRAIDELGSQPPEARLLALMQLLHRERSARYDVAVRAWAAQELAVTQGVEEVDRQRFQYVRQIFHEMGFRGADLDLRTRLFVVYHSSYEAMHLSDSGLDADEDIRHSHAFFTRA